MIATEDKANTWLGIRDIAVNADEVVTEEDPGTLSTDKLTLKGGSLNNLLDDSNTIFYFCSKALQKREKLLN